MSLDKKFISFTKRAKANLLDFALVILCAEVLLVFCEFGFHLDFYWANFVAIPAYFVLSYFAMLLITCLNKIMWEYSGGKAFLILILNVLVASIITYILTLCTFGFDKAKLYAFFTAGLFFGSYTVLACAKMLSLQLYIWKHKKKHEKEMPLDGSNNTAIIGAGWTGTALAKTFENDNSIFKPVCFIDDSDEKYHKEIQGLPVAGPFVDLDKIIEKYEIKKLLFAIPSCEKNLRKKMIAKCLETKCQLKVVPSIQEMVNTMDKSSIQPRDVRIEDLLGREPNVFDSASIKDYIQGNTILVTGGGGSIGSELCRQIASFSPKKLVIMDIYENNAYDIQMELKRHYPDLDLEVDICSIADYDRCNILFDTFRPDYVFHAAAHKHVPLMEHVPEQAIKNNVVGTWNLCQLSMKYNVKRFLLISTDKAVNPTNVMGASKRCCEMIVKYHSQICKTTAFCAVRFGNVLGSNGSVIPLFKQQIKEGGPVTLTDRNIIRYFMTIPEAVALVLETGGFALTGEIFVLDMGTPVKILDLAENMIRLMGYKPYEDIDIVFTGLRPGEKLFEELLISGEGMRKTSNEKIFICKQIDINEDTFVTQLNDLIDTAKTNNVTNVMAKLHALIPTYHVPQIEDAK